MKKLLLVVACVMAVLGAQAQTEVGALFIRPMVGLSVTGFRGDISDTKYRLGTVFGGELEYRVARPVGLSAGLMFSKQGCGLKDADDVTITTNYLTLPVLLNYYITDNFAVKAGVQPGLMAYSNVEVKKNGKNVAVENVDDWFKKFDLAIPIGCSFTFSDFQIDARYNLSVTNIADKIATEYGEAGNKMYNSVFEVTVGYNFRIN